MTRLHTGLLQLISISPPEIQMDSAFPFLQKLRTARKGLLKLPDHLHTHLIAAGADGRADTGQSLLRPGTELPPHSLQRLGRNPPYGPLPAAMGNAHSPVYRIQQQDGRTVRKAQQQRESKERAWPNLN